MNRANRILALDREDMSDFERALFLKDLKRVTEEYFECNGDPDSSDGGCSELADTYDGSSR